MSASFGQRCIVSVSPDDPVHAAWPGRGDLPQSALAQGAARDRPVAASLPRRAEQSTRSGPAAAVPGAGRSASARRRHRGPRTVRPTTGSADRGSAPGRGSAAAACPSTAPAACDRRGPSSPTVSSSDSARSCGRATSHIRAAKTRFSRSVRCGYKRFSWATMPIKRRFSCWPPVFSPNQRTSPLLGRISAAIARSKVVLPAPFDPVRTMLSPAATCRSISSSTRRRPNRLVRRRTSMAMRGSVMVRSLSRTCSKTREVRAGNHGMGRRAAFVRLATLPLGPQGNHDAGQPDPSAHPEPADQAGDRSTSGGSSWPRCRRA